MKQKLDSAAILTIKRSADMTPEGRKAIAEWLRKQAKYLIRDGKNYSTRFTARYLYNIDFVDDDKPKT